MEKVEIKLAACIEEVLEILAIRRTVFIEEQDVSEERERDGKDKEATHFLVKFSGKAVGTARLQWLGKTKCKIERMAILKQYRKMGLGIELLKFIENYAKMHKVQELILHSQFYVKDFYKKLGYKPRGKIFLDAKIKHIEMVKRLK